MNSDAVARTRDPRNPGGMAGINPHREGINRFSGSGGESVLCQSLAGKSEAMEAMEGMEGIIVTRRVRARIRGQGAGTLLSCVGFSLSPPSPPSPPDLPQPFDLLALSYSDFCQSIPSRFHSIPSIPSGKKQRKQGIVKRTGTATTSSERAMP